jgi:ribosomal protein L9
LTNRCGLSTISRYGETGVIPIAKVLLTTTVERLGHVGEIVNVADGYARNYLLPRGLAVAPTEHNAARFAKEKAAHESELLQREEKARVLRDKLADQTLGPHAVTINLYKDVSVEVRIQVDEEGSKEE